MTVRSNIRGVIQVLYYITLLQVPSTYNHTHVQTNLQTSTYSHSKSHLYRNWNARFQSIYLTRQIEPWKSPTYILIRIKMPSISDLFWRFEEIARRILNIKVTSGKRLAQINSIRYSKSKHNKILKILEYPNEIVIKIQTFAIIRLPVSNNYTSCYSGPWTMTPYTAIDLLIIILIWKHFPYKAKITWHNIVL